MDEPTHAETVSTVYRARDPELGSRASRDWRSRVHGPPAVWD